MLDVDARAHRWFERATLLVIAANCATLGLYQPCDDEKTCKTFTCWILKAADHVLFLFPLQHKHTHTHIVRCYPVSSTCF